jgi:hypothetical protein
LYCEPPVKVGFYKRESTDEHNTDAPSISERGHAAATNPSGPHQRARTGRPDDHAAPRAADPCRSDREALGPAEIQAGGQACEEGGAEAPEGAEESQEESQEARGEGSQPTGVQRARQAQGQGAEVGQEEALSVSSAVAARDQARIRLRSGS